MPGLRSYGRNLIVSYSAKAGQHGEARRDVSNAYGTKNPRW